jgi:signal transduction histidine kinase
VTGVIEHVKDITEQKMAEESLHLRAQELTTLNTVARWVNASLSLDQISQAALEAIVSPLNLDLALLYLRQGQDLLLLGAAPRASAFGHNGTPVHRIGECLCGLAIHDDRALFSVDIDHDARCTWNECKEAGLHSLAALPLRSRGESIGVLALASAGAQDFAAMAPFLETLADQIATGVQNARLHEELQRHADQLEARVAERTAELTAVNHELEAFAYSVSHDLRAPLRSVDGFSQALQEDCADQLDALGQDYLHRIRGASQRMGHLIDDLLQLSRLTRSDMRWERADLSTLARSIAADLQASQPERQVEMDIAPGIVTRGDASLLRVVLENLMGNAWKFTAKQARARIEFGAVQNDDEQVFWVRDDGVGFDMAYADKLFGAFQRLHSVAEFEGSGIGLATVQRIVHRHGGRVWAEGEPGRGAAFFFTLSPPKEC